jgi:protease-4
MDSNLPPNVPPLGAGNPTPPPLIAPPPLNRMPPARRRSGWWWVLAIAALGFVCLLTVGAVLAGIFSLGGSSTAHLNGRWLEEHVLESTGSRHKIAVVDVDGIIMDVRDEWTGSSPVRFFRDQLECAARDERVKAVLLRINSPGGEVLASDEISEAIRRFQRESGKPVIASLGSLAASGGYYIAAPCRWIVASEMTLTGSIGVILSTYNLRGLLDKVGVLPLTFTSGPYKDMLSMSKNPAEITDQERAMIQSLVNETYQRFAQVVLEGRQAAARANGGAGRTLPEDWPNYADGRILSGRQAHEHGFVDELGNFETAVARAEALAGIDDANLVQYRLPLSFGSLFRLFSRAEPATVKVDLGFDSPRLPAGRLYFLPPSLLQ